ncbi:MAG: hypothetical protein VW577_00615 [Pelagibacteraceae bacterium]
MIISKARRKKIDTICRLFYYSRHSTMQIAEYLNMREHEIWNVLANHGQKWNSKETKRAERH